MNLKGMGEGASIEWIDCSTGPLPAGYFWCERFRGPHISVDYEWGDPVLTVLGETAYNDCRRFSRWVKLDLAESPAIPDVLYPVVRSSKFWNIEYIGGKAIEIQAHHNADFQWGNVEAIPVYRRENSPKGAVYGRQEKPPRGQGWKYINAPDGERLGLYIR